jgi:hypothetical protein
VHGFFGIIDELKRTALCGDAVLVAALETWGEDASVFLPEAEIERRLRLLRKTET